MDGLDLSGRASLAARGAAESALDALRAQSGRDAPAVAAKKFEALFATLLVKEMRQTLSEGFFGSGPQSDVYAGWLDQTLGEALAQDGSLHLADGVRESLERKQEVERAAAEVRVAGAQAPAGLQASTGASVSAETGGRAEASAHAATNSSAAAQRSGAAPTAGTIRPTPSLIAAIERAAPEVQP